MEDTWRLAISRDGRMVAAGNSLGTVKVWQPETGEELVELLAHRSELQGLAFSPDGSTLATSAEGSVKLWDVTAGEQLATFKRAGGGGLPFPRTESIWLPQTASSWWYGKPPRVKT